MTRTFLKTAILAASVALSAGSMLTTGASAETHVFRSAIGSVVVDGNNWDGYRVRHVGYKAHSVGYYTSCQLGYLRNHRGYCVPVVYGY